MRRGDSGFMSVIDEQLVCSDCGRGVGFGLNLQMLIIFLNRFHLFITKYLLPIGKSKISYLTCFLVTGTLGCDTAMADDIVIPSLVFQCLRFTKSLKKNIKQKSLCLMFKILDDFFLLSRTQILIYCFSVYVSSLG